MPPVQLDGELLRSMFIQCERPLDVERAVMACLRDGGRKLLLPGCLLGAFGAQSLAEVLSTMPSLEE
ncbi:hypothetical protein KIPB_015752, partial [Kipferlia bialata]|eukprot:g15752.t1